MKLSKQMWLIIAIILVGIAAAGLILKADKPKAEAGHGDHAEHAEEASGEHADHAEEAGAEHEEHAEEATDKKPEHGEAEHDHEKDHDKPAMLSESTKGPHGGKLFTDGDYAIEVTIFEQNEPPQFRLYAYSNNKPLASTSTTVSLKLSRLGREPQIFKFTPEKDYLTSKLVVEEPHSFKVAIEATHADKTHQFAYEQVEARVSLTAKQLKDNAIEILTAAPANIQTNLRLLGQIKLNADKAVQVLPRMSGIVESVTANVGDSVKKGQTLAVVSSLDVAENRGDLSAAQQRLNLAKTTLAREESLWREKISAEQDYLAAKNDLQLAQIELAQQQQKLASMGVSGGSGSRYTLKAPIDGVITRKNVATGQVLELTQMMFEVADLNTVWAEMNIPIKDLGLVKTGQKVTVRASSFEQNTEGTITYIAPLVDLQSRTAIARVVMPNMKQNWLVGLPVNIDLVADEVTVPLAVSLEAIQTLQYGDVVFGRYGDSFEARPVELGRRDSKYVEVLSGLSAGEQYAAGNSFVVKAELGKAGASHDH
ncbi:MAG: efflux transporter periplasmic adaptor subunit [Methylotenera sp.]|nr:MAG: efflux transporter periplasmic adaptor subunit [Methylotenera sp.]PPD49877.1 MAG: efflux transporter periplasmic adaptor subunit [Methylotenera sp.]